MANPATLTVVSIMDKLIGPKSGLMVLTNRKNLNCQESRFD